MRKLALIGAAVLLACAWALADSRYAEIATGTNTYGEATFAPFRGYVEAIYCDSPDGSTGTVSVSYQPLISTMSAINLATNAVSSDTTWRPAVDMTDVAAAALTSDGPVPYFISGETITFSVTNATTNVTWKCYVVFDPE